MSIFRKILIAALSVCMTVCAGVALAACKDDGEKIINPGEQTGEFKGDYEITVKSQGGLLLDGIKLTFEKDGVQQGEQQISSNGKVAIHLNPDVYDIVVDADSKPGYFVPEGTSYKTTADSKDVNVILSSEVISETAPAGTRYALGDVMYDFSFTDIDGIEYSLSETLKTKNTVVLNFWGTKCVPCRNEFPALQNAYEAYESKLELFALSSYNNQGTDTVDMIKTFRDITNAGSLKFPMALDTETKIYSYFNVSNYPTTVIIDRYGVVARRIEGSNASASSWKAEFNKYTGDNYSQAISGPGNGNNNGTIVRVPADESLKMPASSEIYSAITKNIAADDIRFYYDFDTETNPEAKLNWPWMIGEKNANKYLYASNEKAKESWSILYCDVKLKAGEGFSFDYYTDTQSDYNTLYVIANGTIVDSISNASGDWVTQKVYVANRRTTLNLSFVFMKDDDVADDTHAYLDNFTIYDAAAEMGTVDLAYSITDEADFNNGKYDVNVELGEDGLYRYTFDYKGTPKTAILYADIVGVTSWADKHFGEMTFDTTFEYEGEDLTRTLTTSLYNIAYYKMSNMKGVGLDFNFGYTNNILKSYYLQTATINCNGYVPVNEEVKDMINAFIDYAYRIGFVDDERYADQWLEFCYYFMHWGDEHVYVDRNTLSSDKEVSYNSSTDVYTVDTAYSDKRVYIDFYNESFSMIDVKAQLLQKYTLKSLLDQEMFENVNGHNYTAIVNEYYDSALKNKGYLLGLVKADQRIVKILEEFVEYIDKFDDFRILSKDWRAFASYLSLNSCDEYDNPAEGLTFDYAIDAQLGNNTVSISEILNITPIPHEAGGGIKFKFKPDTDGIYSFTSSYSGSETDPNIAIYDSQFRMLAHQEDDIRYDHFERNDGNFFVYVYLKAGETYYINASLGDLVETSYKMNISYAGKSAQLLRVATTGDGTWFPRPSLDENGNVQYDENGDIIYNWNDTYYGAVETAPRRGVYWQVNSDGSLGSKMYIDFIHSGYYALTNSNGSYYYPSLYELITTFNRFDADTKAVLLDYYEQSLENEGELHGMVEASEELVDILISLMEKDYGEEDSRDTGAWKMFACYYVYYGAPDAE